MALGGYLAGENKLTKKFWESRNALTAMTETSETNCTGCVNCIKADRVVMLASQSLDAGN